MCNKEGKVEHRIRSKGQITIVLALVLMVVVSLLLSMVEAARSAALEVKLECAAQTAIYSLFAQYHKELANRYDLLFIDSSFQTNVPSFAAMEETLQFYTDQNCMAPKDQFFLNTRDWYGIENTICAVEAVRLASDSESPAFYQQAVAYMKDLVTADYCEDIQSWITVIDKESIDPDELVKKNKKSLENADGAYEGDGEWNITEIYPEFDLQRMFGDKEMVWFTGVNKPLSSKKISTLNTYSFRHKNEGSSELSPKGLTDPLQDIYFNEYILLKLGSFTGVEEGGALDYQTEYVLQGKGSDAENLFEMCKDIFLLRAAANMIPLSQSEEAKMIVETISAFAVLIDLPPDVVKPLLYILWAGAEGLLDTQDLLNGGRVPLMKAYKDFSISLKGITTVGEGLYMRKIKTAITDGLCYEDYLRIFLTGVSRRTRISRCADMIEANIRLTEENEFFRLDACVDVVIVQISLETGFGHFYSLRRKYSYF